MEDIKELKEENDKLKSRIKQLEKNNQTLDNILRLYMADLCLMKRRLLLMSENIIVSKNDRYYARGKVYFPSGRERKNERT